jgi:hypothetical protein
MNNTDPTKKTKKMSNKKLGWTQVLTKSK